MLKFSVIIPVYNTPFDIYKECIDSIASCMGNGDELIIVDDGSTVEYFHDYEAYVSDICNVIFSRTENKGVSSARNAGLSCTCGDYIIFVDSDDMLVNDCLNELRATLQETPVDMLCFENVRGKEYLPSDSVRPGKVVSIDLSEKNDIKNAAFLYSKKYNYLDLNTIWGKAYKRELIAENSIVFPTGLKRMEDVMFNLDFLQQAGSMSYCDSTFYFYRTGTSFSTVNSFQDEYLERFSAAFSAFEEKYSGDAGIMSAIAYKRFVILLDYINNHLCSGNYRLSQAVSKLSSLMSDSTYRDSIKTLKYSDLLSKKECVYLALLKNRFYGVVCAYRFLKNRA